MLIDTPSSDHRFDRLWTATLVGFMFLLRASELEALEVKDVTFGEYDGTRYVRIFIRKSKTDQGEFGVFRSLNEKNKTLRPLRSGGATCLYLAGVGLEFTRRFDRWKSSTFSIYLHLAIKY